MWYELFVLGGVAFWLLLAAATFFFFMATEHDDVPGATVVVVILFLAVWLLFGNLWMLIEQNPWRVLIWPPAWIVAGLAWSFPRWILFLRQTLKEYQRKKNSFLTYQKGGIEAWRKSSEFNLMVREYGIGVDKDDKLMAPTFAHNRWRMVNWVLLWPWSMIWSFGRDVIMELVDFLLSLFGKVYQRVSNWIFQGVE